MFSTSFRKLCDEKNKPTLNFTTQILHSDIKKEKNLVQGITRIYYMASVCL